MGKGDQRLAVGGQRHAMGVAHKEPPPAASSRRRICWLTVDWRKESLRPASLKLAALATAMKVVSSVGSNTGSLIEIHDNSNNGDAASQ